MIFFKTFLIYNKRKQKNKGELCMEIPSHVAIIMDGNGRWAKERGLPRFAGHKAGLDTIKNLIKKASSIGINTLSLYAFSTENWKRPDKEVSYLMSLPEVFLSKELNTLIKNNIRIIKTGFDKGVPVKTLDAFNKAIDKTKNNTGLTVNFAFNYGGRAEIVHVIKEINKDLYANKLSIEHVDESLVSKYLLSNIVPDIDLLIRTSGEIRISNFMIWQLAYSEMTFINSYFPDFNDAEFEKVIYEYQNRERRYGNVK